MQKDEMRPAVSGRTPSTTTATLVSRQFTAADDGLTFLQRAAGLNFETAVPAPLHPFRKALAQAGLLTEKLNPVVTAAAPATSIADAEPWVAAALRTELAALAATPAGTRNHGLNIAALKLGRLPVDRDELKAALIAACDASGLTDDDGLVGVEATIKSGFKKADLDGPRQIPDWPSTVTEVSASEFGAAEVLPISLTEARNVFRKWFGGGYDTDSLDAMLAAVAVERFDDGSDMVWLLIVGGPGHAKTESVQSCDGIGAIVTSSISSEAALLSATPKRERSKDATGGLLRRIGGRGVMVIKDVTSILSMNRDQRAKVLSALREIYDGRWSRDVGTDGGLSIPWTGRIAVIGAVTTAWDTHHAVVSSMGDRFLLVRLDSTAGRQAAGRQAIRNTGHERTMRAELAAAVAGVLSGMNPKPITISEAEEQTLIAAADLVTLARTGVEYDYRGDVIDAHAPEMPTRFTKQLTQIVRGAVALGMDRADALRLAIRCARDSMPPMRLAIVDDLAVNPGSSTAEVRKRIDKPRNTVDRQLQALHMLGVVTVEELEYQSDGKTKWMYSLAEHIEPDAINPKSVPEKSLHTPKPYEGRSEDGSVGRRSEVSPDISGKVTSPPLPRVACRSCGAAIPDTAPAKQARGDCGRAACRAVVTAEGSL